MFFWIVTPILYYRNVFYGQYLPLLSSSTFDRFGKKFNVTKVIDITPGTLDFTFNQAKYEAYSPLYIPSSYSITYALSFASVIAILVHTVLYSRHQLRQGLKGLRQEDEDIHARHARNYVSEDCRTLIDH